MLSKTAAVPSGPLGLVVLSGRRNIYPVKVFCAIIMYLYGPSCFILFR